jgi:tetratricopeptide (TPR) repeat protein
MRRGVAAFGQGDAARALEANEEAKRLVPQANLPYLYAAEALVKLERYPEAIASFEEYIAKKPDVSDAAEVRERIAKLRREHLPGRVRVQSNVTGARVTIDGAPPPAVADPTAPFALAPGKHVIEWTSDGYDPATQEIVVVGDTEMSVMGSLARSAPPPPPPVDSPPPLPPASPEQPTAETSPLRLPGFIAAGAGIATLGTALVIDVTALAHKSDQFNAAKNAGDPSAVGLKSDYQSLRNGVIATYVVGGVLAAGGATMIVLSMRGDSKGGKQAKATIAIEPRVAPGGASAWLVGRF